MAAARPSHTPDLRLALPWLFDVNEDFGERPSHRIGDDTLGDRHCVTQVLRFDFDDERFQM